MTNLLYMRKDKEIGIGIEDFSPLRKKPCLTVIDGCKHIKVASFNDEESVKIFINMCRDMELVKIISREEFI